MVKTPQNIVGRFQIESYLKLTPGKNYCAVAEFSFKAWTCVSRSAILSLSS